MGPYTIVNILDEDTYEIQGEEGRTISPVHAQQLKRYIPAEESNNLTVRSSPEVAPTLPPRDSSTEPTAATENSQGNVQPRATAKRRGPPRKTALLVRPGKRASGGRPTSATGPTEPKHGPGRPKGSKKKPAPIDADQISPRPTRASVKR